MKLGLFRSYAIEIHVNLGEAFANTVNSPDL